LFDTPTVVSWSFFHRAEDRTTWGHSWKLVKNHCRRNTRLQFFSQRVVNRWNSIWGWCWRAISKLLQKSSWEKKKPVRWTSLKTH